MKCILCKSIKFTIISFKVRDSKKHKIIKCRNCRHIQLYPILTGSAYKKFYDENRQVKNIKFDFKIEELEKKSEYDVNRRLDIIKKKSTKRDKILEIGSGNGFFLKKMHHLGFNITGIEISKERREISKKVTDAPVLDYNEFDNSKSHGEFDLIVLFQVLEHIPEPVNFLKKLSKFLKNNGTIIIEVPNVDDFQLEINKFYRDWYWQKAHINYFSKEILKKVLKKAHFQKIKIEGIQRYSIENMFNWKITGKPQTIKPIYQLSTDYSWIENNYKKYLQKKLLSDTLVITAKKIDKIKF